MTSKPSSPNRNNELLAALTTYDVSEGNGVVEMNIADALMAIATAINRLAIANEQGNARASQMAEQLTLMTNDGGGHA